MGRSLHPDTREESDEFGKMKDLIQISNGTKSSRVRKLAAPLMRLWLTLRYRWLSRRYRRLVLEEINGVPLIVLPDVFNPVLLRSGEFLARYIESCDLKESSAVLDLGTGSGVGAIFAAQRSSDVTAVDINPAAVRCTRINALLNQLDGRITVLLGDLFDPVHDRRFDLVIFNPPFYLGRPDGELDRAWRGEGVFERFSEGLNDALKPGGSALLLLSSDGDGEALLSLLSQGDFRITIVSKKDLINEILTIYEVKSNVLS
jgi:HemK-related putative methylase